jgi:Family of unknown function (DUF6582)
MSTTKQKEAARRNIEKAQRAQKGRRRGSAAKAPAKTVRSSGLRTAEKNRLDDEVFAFPRERKEPLIDARHVRNAVARFDQVEGVTDTERDRAWRRIGKAAEKFGVEIEEQSWHELFAGSKVTKKRAAKKTAAKKTAAKKTAAKKTAARKR